MKNIILSALVVGMTFSALAGESAQVKKSTGKASVYNLTSQGEPSEQSSIDISGKAAEKLFDDLDNELLQGVADASEAPDGMRTDMKVGENITCYQRSKPGKRVVSCNIFLENKKSGKVGQGAAG